MVGYGHVVCEQSLGVVPDVRGAVGNAGVEISQLAGYRIDNHRFCSGDRTKRLDHKRNHQTLSRSFATDP